MSNANANLQPIVNTERSGDQILAGQKMGKESGFANVNASWLSRTLSYEQGLNRLAHERSESEDIMATVKEMRPTVNKANGGFVMEHLMTGRLYSPTEHALNQLGGWAGIGTWFPNTLVFNNERSNDAGDSRTLVKAVENGLRFFDPTKKFLWRTRSDGTLRAMLSDRYAILDNEWLLNTLQALVPGGRLSHWKGDSDTIYGNVLIPDTIRQEEDSEYGGMLSVGNSEIGVRRLSSTPSLFRAICYNGCIWGQAKGVAYSQVHRGKTIDYAKTFEELKVNLEKQIPLITQAVEPMLLTKLWNWKGESVKPLFAQIAKEIKLGKKDANRLLLAWQAEPISSAFGAIQAVTRASQLMNNETGLRSDEWAGDFVMSGVTAWNRVSNRAASLSAKEVENAFSSAV